MTDATAHDWEAWLRPIAIAVRNTPSANDVKGRAAALAFTMQGIPASALTPDKARDICRKAEFFPSVAEIEAVFAEAWKEAARSRSIAGSGLAQIASAYRNPMTPEQRAASVSLARSIAAELRANARHAAPDKPKPRPLAPAALLAAYEAAGTPAAAYRAAQLRQQVEAE